MRRILLRCAWIPTLLLASGAIAQTDASQSIDELRHWAEAFLTDQLRTTNGGDATPYITAGTLDSRLRLQRCTGNLQGIMPANGPTAARMTLGIHCSAPAWTVYIPMSVATELRVLVMRAAAARDSSPAATDVELQQLRVPGIATNYLTSVEQLRGRHLKVAVSPGTILSTEVLATDILIKRGQRVTLVANLGTIEVRAQGEAIADANDAGRVRVLNLSSRKIVEGQVESGDRVRVGM